MPVFIIKVLFGGKIMKKLLVILLAIFMLAGCSGGGKDSGGKDANVIVIGGSGPLSGGAAVYGNAVKNAAVLAADEINAKGGLQIKLLFEDDEHNTEKAVTAFNALLDGGMQIGLGCVTSDPAATTSP